MKKLLLSAAMIYALGCPAAVPTYLDNSRDLDSRVADALSRMTLEEKVALCHAQSKFSSAGVPRLGIPGLWWSDGPHGVRAEINWDNWEYAGWTSDSITAFPALSCLAATWNPDLALAYGNALGEEALYREKDVILGPGVNICRTPMNGRNFEYMGEDPFLTSRMAVPYIRGLQDNGVAASVKHFALNNQEEDRMYIDVQCSPRALHEIYLPAFRAAVTEGEAWTVMGAYNRIDGQYASHNDRMLNGILKGDWDFDGVVVSDWGGAHDTLEAAANGLDVEMGSYTNGLTSESALSFDEYYLANPYLALLREGKVSRETLDDKAGRILKLIFRTSMNSSRGFGCVADSAHYAVAREIGREGIVLLKNSPVRKGERPLLPVDASKYRRILVVGDNAVRNLCDGGGSSELKVKDMVSPLRGLAALWGDKIEYAPGYAAGRASYDEVEEVSQAITDSLRADAVEKARAADLVIVVGGLNKNRFQDCEDGDRKSFGLPFGQERLVDELLEVNPNVVLALISGNAVELPWIDRLPALLQVWYLGSMGGYALADVLSGAVNPSGRLPFSFPARLEDCGAHSFDGLCYPGDGEREVYKEDIFVGYRWHDSKGPEALFPFGHGLSYTTFEYGQPSLSAADIIPGEDLRITVPVTNNGQFPGKETVQLYLGDVECTLPRPVKELKGFRKIELAPGETRAVEFTVTPADLRFYDPEISGWRSEPGTFKAYIGASSGDIRKTVTFSLSE